MPTKVKKVFEKYLEAIKRLGSDFEFYKMIKPLDNTLKKEHINLTPAKFFAVIFDELEKGTLHIPYSQLKDFFEIIPNSWQKERITDEILMRKVPPSDWRKYRSSEWIRKHKAA